VPCNPEPVRCIYRAIVSGHAHRSFTLTSDDPVARTEYSRTIRLPDTKGMALKDLRSRKKRPRPRPSAGKRALRSLNVTWTSLWNGHTCVFLHGFSPRQSINQDESVYTQLNLELSPPRKRDDVISLSL